MKDEDFFVRDQGLLKRIDSNELIIIEAAANYVNLHFIGNRKFMVRSSLQEALAKFPKGVFAQIHRSYAVRVSCVMQVGRTKVMLQEGDKIIALEFSGRYMNKLLECISVFGKIENRVDEGQQGEAEDEGQVQ
jgi:DNA-binding LytR/AlgR family response regulator